MADQASSNGHKKPTGKVRVAIVGAGNCASALVQGVHYYHDAKPNEFVPGLMHVDLGGYHISDIEFTAAFDVDADKVGRDLGEAIFRGQNNTVKFAEVPKLNVPVHRGMTHDGIGKYLSKVIKKAPGETADVVRILQETGTDVVVSYLPVGSEEATKWYVEQVLSAGCAFVNCVPVFIAREPYWQRRFEEKGLPIVGDDIKSQVGATIVHRQLTRLFRERGVKLERTHQLNVGGNTDFMNMLERERLESKKISKTNAVTSQLDYDIGARNVHIGPSDYVEWLDDRKWAYIRMEGRAFGDVPLNIELKLEVIDSPNSAGIVIDAVRCAKLALDNGIAGALEWPVGVLHEVAAGAAPRRPVPRRGGALHRLAHPHRGRRQGEDQGEGVSPLRLCLVSPFALDGAHPVAEHVRGAATALAGSRPPGDRARAEPVDARAPQRPAAASGAGERRHGGAPRPRGRAAAGGDDARRAAAPARPAPRCRPPGGGQRERRPRRHRRAASTSSTSTSRCSRGSRRRPCATPRASSSPRSTPPTPARRLPGRRPGP